MILVKIQIINEKIEIMEIINDKIEEVKEIGKIEEVKLLNHFLHSLQQNFDYGRSDTTRTND